MEYSYWVSWVDFWKILKMMGALHWSIRLEADVQPQR